MYKSNNCFTMPCCKEHSSKHFGILAHLLTTQPRNYWEVQNFAPRNSSCTCLFTQNRLPFINLLHLEERQTTGSCQLSARIFSSVKSFFCIFQVTWQDLLAREIFRIFQSIFYCSKISGDF